MTSTTARTTDWYDALMDVCRLNDTPSGRQPFTISVDDRRWACATDGFTLLAVRGDPKGVPINRPPIEVGRRIFDVLGSLNRPATHRIDLGALRDFVVANAHVRKSIRIGEGIFWELWVRPLIRHLIDDTATWTQASPDDLAVMQGDGWCGVLTPLPSNEGWEHIDFTGLTPLAPAETATVGAA